MTAEAPDIEETASCRCKFSTAHGCRLELAGMKLDTSICRQVQQESECELPSTAEAFVRGTTPDTVASSGDLLERGGPGHESPQRNDLEQGEDQEFLDVISPKTVQTSTTRSHLDLWRCPSETFIIFDWDDTLCPTSYIWDQAKIDWKVEVPPQVVELFEKHASVTAGLLREASQSGHVCIVTLAQDAWFNASISRFMPSLKDVIEELNIEVIFARTALPEKVLKGRASDGFEDIGQALKTAAMRNAISAFYRGRRDGRSSEQPRLQVSLRDNDAPAFRRKSSGSPRSWKNVISIGDSDAEYYSVQDVTFRHRQTDRHGDWKPCRCKAVKLLENPGLDMLTVQLEVLTSWLPAIVSHDGDINLDFEALSKESGLRTTMDIGLDIEGIVAEVQ